MSEIEDILAKIKAKKERILKLVNKKLDKSVKNIQEGKWPVAAKPNKYAEDRHQSCKHMQNLFLSFYNQIHMKKIKIKQFCILVPLAWTIKWEKLPNYQPSPKIEIKFEARKIKAEVPETKPAMALDFNKSKIFQNKFGTCHKLLTKKTDAVC